MNKCLYCYKPLHENEVGMHRSCAIKFFGTPVVPSLNYTTQQLDQLAEQILQEQTSLTGVQPKLSLHLSEHQGSKRLTIVGLWGEYICKPQTPFFQQLPEVEHLTMRIAQLCKINTVPHSLIKMADDTICYLTKRIDRTDGGKKIAMEDMCQITERQTEYKYKSSYERIAKAIKKYSSLPQMDIVNFFEIVLFSWITGNNDMHLKNFSLYETDNNVTRLSPAYDLLSATIVNPKDSEELALTLNGKKNNINKNDFIIAANEMLINTAVVNKLINKYIKLLPSIIKLIKQSFVNDELQSKYIELITSRINKLQ